MTNQDKQFKEEMLGNGTILQQGRYRIERYISSGGFGNTYLAIDTKFDEKVAIKEFFMKGVNQREKDNSVSVSNAANTPKFIEQKEKFNKEAQRIRKLNCENIIKVNDLFDENGTSYYVMDYIDGLSLRDIVRQQGPVNEKIALVYLDQTLHALQEVHSKKIFHLDLKPANLMVDKDNRLRVIDFGASKQQKADGSGASASTALCYTPGYAPMEQKDLRFDKFGPWTDLYSLGATMYYVLTGDTPPDGTDIQDERENAFHFPLTVSDKMQNLIVWMMEYNRSARPQSVQEIRDFIQDGKEQQMSTEIGTVITPKVISSPKQSYSTLPKGRNLLWISMTFFSIVVLGLIYVLGQKMNTNKAETNIVNQEMPQISANLVKGKIYENAVLGDYLYTGPVDAEGVPHGRGTAVFVKNGIPNGNTYEGPIEHGVFSGSHAKFKYGVENTFEGSFKNNMYAEGKLRVNSTGQFFMGTFYEGEPYNGTWYDESGKSILQINRGK